MKNLLPQFGQLLVYQSWCGICQGSQYKELIVRKKKSTPHNILSKPQAAFPHNHCRIMGGGERGINPVTMNIINPRKEYWPSREPATFCS